MERAYGHETFYLAAYNHAGICGGLPLVRIKLPMTKGRLISLPFCDYGGVLADDEDIAQRLLSHALGLAREMRCGLEVRFPASCPWIEDNEEFVQITPKCRMLLELPGNSSLLWHGFKSKLRSQVKRALKNGLTFRLGQAESLEEFYSVFSRNMRDLGSPVHSGRWLREVLSAFEGRARTGIVYHGALVVGGGIILTHSNTVTLPWASTLKEFNRLSPNMLLYWSFMEYAADQGYRFFDFGRSTPGEGTYAFKEQWGARPAHLSWYRYFPGGKAESFSGRSGGLQNKAEKLWRRLPLSLANTLGPQLRKYIDR